MQSHKMTEVHTKGESKSIRSTRILSLCSACLWFPDSSIVLPLFLVYDPEGSRTMRVFPSFFACISTGMCFFAECMHHWIGCKQICRNINRFRFILEYLFYKIFDIRFPIFFFPLQLPHTRPVLPDPEEAEVSCDRSVHRSYPESA